MQSDESHFHGQVHAGGQHVTGNAGNIDQQNSKRVTWQSADCTRIAVVRRVENVNEIRPAKLADPEEDESWKLKLIVLLFLPALVFNSIVIYRLAKSCRFLLPRSSSTTVYRIRSSIKCDCRTCRVDSIQWESVHFLGPGVLILVNAG